MSAVLAPAATPRLSAADAAAVLQQWIADGEASDERMTRAGPGVASPAQWAGKTGLEQMQAMLAGELPFAPIAKTLDFSLIRVEPGLALFQGKPGPAHLNPMGGVHGGWFATMLDSALGCAVHTLMPAGRPRLHHRRAERELRARPLAPGRTRARRGQGDPLRQAAGDGRGAPVRAGWHAVRACHDHLPGVRHAERALSCRPPKKKARRQLPRAFLVGECAGTSPAKPLSSGRGRDARCDGR